MRRERLDLFLGLTPARERRATASMTCSSLLPVPLPGSFERTELRTKIKVKAALTMDWKDGS